ncbi:hypothetical protein RRG08_016130 [Elysia crispata]|uniref:Uncharacterized protein n=1 Tax=Elysia crispata TaxID=231223 RepID=A0AAE1D9V0_9GAST|nr:hypothetical protein RRG08_016130 [Elysia crispata]
MGTKRAVGALCLWLILYTPLSLFQRYRSLLDLAQLTAITVLGNNLLEILLPWLSISAEAGSRPRPTQLVVSGCMSDKITTVPRSEPLRDDELECGVKSAVSADQVSAECRSVCRNSLCQKSLLDIWTWNIPAVEPSLASGVNVSVMEGNGSVILFTLWQR